MKTQSCKAKGRRLQQWVCGVLCCELDLPPEDVRSCSMGAGGEDVQLSERARSVFPYSVECKNRESHNVWQSYQQASATASPPLQPLVCIKRNKSRPLVVLDAEHFVQLHKRIKSLRERVDGIPPTPANSPDSRIDVVLAEPMALRATES